MLGPLCAGLRALNAGVAEKFLALAAVLSGTLRVRARSPQDRTRPTGSEGNLQSSNSIAVLHRILDGICCHQWDGWNQHGADAEHSLPFRFSPSPNAEPGEDALSAADGWSLARIESTRITNMSVDLSSLSREINALAEQVQQHVDRIVNESLTLSEVLRNGVRE